MAMIIIAALSLALLIASVAKHIFLGWPLSLFILCLLIAGYKRGKTPRQLLQFSKNGFFKCLPIFYVLLLVATLISTWMASGTVSALVYYSILSISPTTVVLCGFLFSVAVSMLIGTSVGTMGTVGVVLLALAKAGGINEAVMAGALISGAYVGDKSSPMSSSLYLYCGLVQDDVYRNSKMMIKSSLVPTVLCALIYWFWSVQEPMNASSFAVSQQLEASFDLGIWAIFPAVLLLGLCFFRVPVKRAMTMSIASAVVVAVAIQGQTPLTLLRFALTGFHMEEGHPLANIIVSGGMRSMLSTLTIVSISCVAAALIENGDLLPGGVSKFVNGATNRTSLYLRTTMVAIVSGVWGCGQTVSVVMTAELMAPVYRERGLDITELTRDMGSTAFLLLTLVPWCTSFINPSTILGLEGMQHLPYTVFIYLGAFYNLGYCLVQDVISRRAKHSLMGTSNL